MANNEINCMVQAVLSATKRPEITDELNRIRARQKLADWEHRVYGKVEAEHLAELLKAAGDPRRVEVDTIRSLDSLIAAGRLAQTINADVFVGLPRTTQDARPHIVHVEERLPTGFQSDQQFLPDYEITEILSGQDEIPIFFAFSLFSLIESD